MCVCVCLVSKEEKRRLNLCLELILLRLPAPSCFLWCSTSACLAFPLSGVMSSASWWFGDVLAVIISTEGPGESCKDTWFMQGRWTQAGRGRVRSSEKCWVLGSVRMTWGPKCLGVDCWGVSEVKLWAERVEGCTHAGPDWRLVQSVLPYQVQCLQRHLLCWSWMVSRQTQGSCIWLRPGVKREHPSGLALKDQMTT